MNECAPVNKKIINCISDSIKKSSDIDPELFIKYNVKRGLRNSDHSGVLVGLTNIGEVIGYLKDGDKVVPTEGRLLYRGIDIKDLVEGVQQSKRHGFDEVNFLLLTGRLPDSHELHTFEGFMAGNRSIPSDVVNNFILSLSGRDIMNMLSRTILGLYTLDDKADDLSHHNQVKQSLELTAKIPAIIIYAYFGMRHNYYQEALIIRPPRCDLSTAENFLYMLKGEEYTALEAELLDLALVLHAEHGGGNNSSFAIRVTSSSGTDTYSAVAAAMASLKGYLHGGANLKALDMIEDIQKNVSNWDDDDKLTQYLLKILNKEAHDKSGKIYGIGHAIYTYSDPRAVLLKQRAKQLAIEKGMHAEFKLYENIERLAPQVFAEFKGVDSKILCANVDFYSGFVYTAINIPKEIYTPFFAMARVAGWCAHRIEELNFDAKRIIRPAYKNVFGHKKYIPIDERPPGEI